MALTLQTMTDEQRKSVALEYLKAFDNGGVTSAGGSILDLFADDAQVYFPKWGLATGKERIGQLFADVGGTITSIVHHYSHFNWVFSADVVVCEGTSHGEHPGGGRPGSRDDASSRPGVTGPGLTGGRVSPGSWRRWGNLAAAGVLSVDGQVKPVRCRERFRPESTSR